MKVILVDHTNHPKAMLSLAKNTRLLKDPRNSYVKPNNEDVEYCFKTIKGCLEFVDFTFLISGVTRAFTHQLVRHRVGVSFAQQSMRAVNMNNFEVLVTGSCQGNKTYDLAIKQIKIAYQSLVDSGVAPEDARGILPTNILTNILMKINLRALMDMMSQRLCNRAQEEFMSVMEEIRKSVYKAMPFLEGKLQCYCDQHKVCFFKNGKGCGKYEECR